MIPYFIIYLTSIIQAFFIHTNLVKPLKRILAFSLILTLSVLLLLRDESIGTDTENYVRTFDFLAYSSSAIPALITSGVEIGFVLLTYFLKKIIENNYVVFFIYGILINALYVKAAIKQNLNLVIFLCFFFSFLGLYIMSFNILRQCIALAIIFYATTFILEGKNKKFILMCILASLFHYSAIVCLPFIWAYKFRNTLYRFWYLVMAGTVASCSSILMFFSTLNERYSSYASSPEDGNNLKSLTLLSLYLIILAFSLFGLKFISLKYRSNFKFYSILYTIYISIVFFSYSLGFSNQALDRIIIYFAWPAVFIVDLFLKSIPDKNLRYIFNLFLFGLLSLFFIKVISEKGDSMAPFIFNNLF